jgi:2,4'-dihydroxyacetophenone dioxygenase
LAHSFSFILAHSVVQRERIIGLMIDTESLSWLPIRPGESLKLLYADAEVRVLLLRLEPGVLIPRHRHLGEVHAFNLAGSRKLLDTGEIAGPGAYVYEPPGNVDSWMSIGDEPLIVHITAYGAMEYLGENDEVLRVDTPQSLEARWRGRA